ncbi:hypothetical protein HGRIS_007571 [Hohenbuehelia grisea]|uniref:Mitochondrial import inner membrane translocase subunit Tim21 n=1 Tax=Hohenbuehelia grisea TaxID=104357 RepID=A0ABR3J587_9AGAR
MRTTARTTNLTVILLGAGLSALLIYSLTTELFSKNSPTVLYGDACERIKNSPQVAKYLHGPLIFHNNPPSTVRPKHRNRHVSSQIMVDSKGREHMIMNFYIQGSPPGSERNANASYLESISAWTQSCVDSLSGATLDESIEWAKDSAQDVWESSKSVFRYLSGAPMPPPPIPSSTTEAPKVQTKTEGSAWSFAGMFSSIKGSRGGPSEPSPETGGRTFTDGEVHADLIRNNDGYFVFRYILIDLPNSRSRDSVRVFVERAPSVRMDEPVLRWDS